MNNLLRRKPFITTDGSTSLRLTDFEEAYHSKYGAYSESMHIYINHGLKYFDNNTTIHILEMGFGTGLNTLLTLLNQEKRTIYYHTVEAYPLSLDEVGKLNYTDKLEDDIQLKFLNIHRASENDKDVEISSNFYLTKFIQPFETMFFKENYYQLVYFDAFSPNIQPELWSVEIFSQLYSSMTKGSILVSYCTKGSVKRGFKSVGFDLQTLSGACGKREMLFCTKK